MMKLVHLNKFEIFLEKTKNVETVLNTDSDGDLWCVPKGNTFTFLLLDSRWNDFCLLLDCRLFAL